MHVKQVITNEFQLSTSVYHFSFSFSFSFSSYSLPKGGPTFGLSGGVTGNTALGTSVLVRMVLTGGSGSLSGSSIDLPCFPQPRYQPRVLQLLAIQLGAPPFTT